MRLLAFKMPARVASRSRASTKGRGGRKGGSDRRSSGPERRRVLKPQNYSLTPAIKAWRPPVPQPLPPAPLLGPRELLGLGALVLLQLWGWLNGRPRRFAADPAGEVGPITGTLPPPGNTTPGTLTIARSAGIQRFARNNCNIFLNTSGPGFSNSYTDVLGVTLSTTMSALCVGRVQGKTVTITRTQNRTVQLLVMLNEPWGYIYNTEAWGLSWSGPNAVLIEPPGTVVPLPDGYAAPAPKVATDPPPPLIPPPPLSLPAVLPVALPVLVSIAPPASEQSPIPQPLSPTIPGRTPAPRVLPGSVTLQNGALPAVSPAPVPVTDPGAVVPWPGAAPIPGAGPAPRPTPEGIAQELGRLERKLEVINTPGAPGNLVDRFADLSQLIGPILEALLSASSGTVYTLDSPCELDADGNRLPAVEVVAPGALSELGAITNRIDALAELIQAHKNLKQPNCRGADVPISGEFVTVNFEQVDQ